jgi:hypothetical protein
VTISFRLLVATVLVGSTASGAGSQALPPIVRELANKAGVVCIRVDDSGAVSGAFILVTTGDGARDRALVAWVRHLRWDSGPGEPWRNRWFPMPVAFGNATPPPSPENCAPPADMETA